MNIDYQKLLDESLLEFVKKVLGEIQNEGIGVNHHFYISFLTDDPLVILSPRMKQRYPKEITIVLQYQYEDLQVWDDKFSVKLSFDGVRETISVPFRALTAFVDPSVKFSLQFRHKDHEQFNSVVPPSPSSILKKNGIQEVPAKTEKETVKNTSNVIALDKFRNKKKS